MAFSRGKRACKPPENRRSTPPMDTRNPRHVTGALPVSWIGIRYLMEKAVERRRGECFIYPNFHGSLARLYLINNTNDTRLTCTSPALRCARLANRTPSFQNGFRKSPARSARLRHAPPRVICEREMRLQTTTDAFGRPIIKNTTGDCSAASPLLRDSSDYRKIICKANSAGDAQVPPPALRVSTGGGDHLLSDGPYARLPLISPMERIKINRTPCASESTLSHRRSRTSSSHRRPRPRPPVPPRAGAGRRGCSRSEPKSPSRGSKAETERVRNEEQELESSQIEIRMKSGTAIKTMIETWTVDVRQCDVSTHRRRKVQSLRSRDCTRAVDDLCANRLLRKCDGTSASRPWLGYRPAGGSVKNRRDGRARPPRGFCAPDDSAPGFSAVIELFPAAAASRDFFPAVADVVPSSSGVTPVTLRPCRRVVLYNAVYYKKELSNGLRVRRSPESVQYVVSPSPKEKLGFAKAPQDPRLFVVRSAGDPCGPAAIRRFAHTRARVQFSRRKLTRSTFLGASASTGSCRRDGVMSYHFYNYLFRSFDAYQIRIRCR
ncbi:hypothetical protein EVAR_77704_1 [Eumeta japonica]|uniref:Uncharacterized protein n=1 Tax=Eumeta variegata TaxID=151549 RepID=A0A4C1TBR0_EUMVA|nr:hypothetical protein EVAR_77704_1 [Eumeta japonica]